MGRFAQQQWRPRTRPSRCGQEQCLAGKWGPHRHCLLLGAAGTARLCRQDEVQICGHVSQASALAIAAFEGAVLPLNPSPWLSRVCTVLQRALRHGPVLRGQVADTEAAVTAL